MKTLRFIHRWLGFITGILLFIACLTATYLSAYGLVSHINKPDQHHVAVLTIDEKAQATNDIFTLYPKAKSITYPSQSAPYYEVFNQGSRIQLDEDYNIISKPNVLAKEVWRFMFFMHRNFHLGDVGAQTNAVASAITIVLSIVGLVLLIPIYKALKLRHAIPKNAKRASLIRSHQLLGLFIFIPLFIAAITGLSLTWRQPVQSLLTGGEKTAEVSKQKVKFNNYGEAITLAQKMWPSSTVSSVLKRQSRRKKGQSSLTIRFEDGQSAWLQNANTISLTYPQARKITLTRFDDMPVNEQVYQLIRPLHDGTRLPVAYTVWLFLTMLVTSYVIGATTYSLGRTLAPK